MEYKIKKPTTIRNDKLSPKTRISIHIKNKEKIINCIRFNKMNILKMTIKIKKLIIMIKTFNLKKQLIIIKVTKN